jgi:hypothetical protein
MRGERRKRRENASLGRTLPDGAVSSRRSCSNVPAQSVKNACRERRKERECESLNERENE